MKCIHCGKDLSGEIQTRYRNEGKHGILQKNFVFLIECNYCGTINYSEILRGKK